MGCTEGVGLGVLRCEGGRNTAAANVAGVTRVKHPCQKVTPK